MKTKTLTIIMGIALLSTLIWTKFKVSHVTSTSEAAIARAQRERDDAIAKAATLEKELSQAMAARPEEELTKTQYPAPADERLENALDAWIANVRTLTAFLRQHPEKRIPQMDLLTDEDWLDVTRGKLESEADYREALGRLRGLARRKVASDIGKALKDAIAANGGNIPPDPQFLTTFLPADFNREILGQMVMNPSGKMAGVVGDQQFVLLDSPVDLWDATLFYSTEGATGMKSAQANGAVVVKKAITNFVNSHGIPPTSVSQLMQYPGVSNLDPSTLAELFRAISTTPSL